MTGDISAFEGAYKKVCGVRGGVGHELGQWLSCARTYGTNHDHR